MKKNKSSLLKDKPLCNPGQSPDEQIHELIEDHIGGPVLLASFAGLLAGEEWWRYYHSQAAAPGLYSVAAVIALVYAAFRIYKAWPRLRALKLGREKAVGQFLEALRKKGYRVFHDVIGDGFNIDHVLIGPAGVFTVETKTLSKPAKGNPPVTFNGETILLDGFEPDRNPVVQAKAQASWLRELLAQSTGRPFEDWKRGQATFRLKRGRPLW